MLLGVLLLLKMQSSLYINYRQYRYSKFIMKNYSILSAQLALCMDYYHTHFITVGYKMCLKTVLLYKVIIIFFIIIQV